MNVDGIEAQPAPRPKIKHGRLLYALSTLFALSCLAVIVFIWQREYTKPPALFPSEALLTTQADVTRFMQEHPPQVTADDPLILIPTGLVIQTVEFKGPYTVQVGGYIWQRYANDLPALDYGVVFPEADSTTFTKVYETQQGDETLVGWNFKTTLREQFDYSKYPLDRQLLWLRIWHVDFEKNVFVMPDLAGYSTLAPRDKPGLDNGLVLENWEMEASYFSYRLVRYNSNFGIQDYQAEVPQPDLYFNIPLKRYILSPLISRGIAPLVILLQLFVIVMVIGTDNKRLEQFGVRPGAVIFTCAAFLFAVLLAQNALRDEIKWYGIVYLETVHVLTYFAILAVALNSVALVAFPQLGLFRENDNAWVEIFYWPLIMLTLLVITLLNFP